MTRSKQARRAPSLHQTETPVKTNSTEASDESDLDTPNLKGNKQIKEKLARDRKVKKDGEAYM